MHMEARAKLRHRTSSAGSSIDRANALLLFNDTEKSTTMASPAGSWTLPGGGVGTWVVY